MRTITSTKPFTKYPRFNMLVYLAAPYSDKDPDVKEQRIANFCLVDAKLSLEGYYTVSPMLKSLLFRYTSKVPSTWEFWQGYGEEIIKACNKMFVIMLDGWEESEGVQGEIELANKYGIEIEYIDPDKYLEI